MESFAISKDPNRCALEELTPASLDLPAAISDLAKRNISPDTFHLENNQRRFVSLAACSPGRRALFEITQADLSLRIGNMTTPQIAGNLRRLYERAYHYDAATRTMDVGDDAAKRELDLWIAVIDNRAFQDEAFLNRILETGSETDSGLAENPGQSIGRSEESREIETIMALNSPNLSSRDRGTFYRLRSGLITWKDAARENTMEEWLRSYDGKTPMQETPFMKSETEFGTAVIAWWGREAVQQIDRANFSESRLRLMAGHLGLSREFAAFQKMTDKALMGRAQDLMGLTVGHPDPEILKKVVREAMIIYSVLSGRGGDYDTRFRESLIRNLTTQFHFTREDAELVVGHVWPSMTASRLDDYQRRNEFLGKFKDLYREFLTTPLEERFSPERMARINMWGQWILNNGRMQGAPITIDEIDRIRRDVQQETGIQTSGAMTWEQLVSRDVRQPLFMRPEELGGLSSSGGLCAEPLAVSQNMTVNGRPLADIVRENVDFIAILPPELVPVDHATGVAYGLFGIVILNGGQWRTDHGQVPSPGYFHIVLAHEVAGHLVWARTQFDDHPERLAWLGPNERYAYTIGQMALDAYIGTECTESSEQAQLIETLLAFDARIAAADRRLGLDPGDRTPYFMRPEWEGKPAEYFNFQPGYLVGPDGREFPDEVQKIRDLPETERRNLTQIMWEDGSLYADLSDKDDHLLQNTLSRLDRLAPDAISETFGSTHPLVRSVNTVLSEAGMPPVEHLTLTRDTWNQMKANLLTMTVAAYRRKHQIMQSNVSTLRDSFRLRDLRAEFWKREAESLPEEEKRLLTNAVDRLDGLSPFRHVDPPLDFPPSHPIVKIYNRYADAAGGTPIRKLRVGDPILWYGMEVFLLKSFEHSNRQCRPPVAASVLP